MFLSVTTKETLADLGRVGEAAEVIKIRSATLHLRSLFGGECTGECDTEEHTSHEERKEDSSFENLSPHGFSFQIVRSGFES
jgi:hypothetical protein